MFSALVVALSAGLLAPQEPAPSPQPAHPWSELVLKGGAVWTGAEPWPDGVAISCRYGQLERPSARHPGHVVVDLPAGAFVMPGLQDAHGHLLGLGSSLVEVDLVGTSSYREVVERARAAAKKLPPGAWIVGRGWDQNDWTEKRMPHHRLLSEAVPDHPVWLARIDGHAGLANQRALDEAGITRTSVAPSGGASIAKAATSGIASATSATTQAP